MDRKQLDRAWSLLDRLDWYGRDATAVDIAVAEHGSAVHAALEVTIPLVVQWLGEAGPSDAHVAERADTLRLLRQLATQVRNALQE